MRGSIGQWRAAIKRQKLLFTFCASTFLSLSGAAAAMADAAIVVNASQPPLSLSGGDDLKTLQNIFQGANIPAEPASDPQLTAVQSTVAALKLKRLRFLQSDIVCDLTS